MPPFADDAARWRAVQTRDAAADGVFVYAVRTTRIYCRPNCKARLARRANVAFYGGPPAAEAAGFRACKRCRPQAAGPTPADAAVARVQAVLAAESRTAETAPGLAAQAGVSRWHFHRTVKQVTGLTPAAYLQQRRRQQAASGSEHSREPPADDVPIDVPPDSDWRTLPLFGDQGLAAMQALAREMAVPGAWEADGCDDDTAWLTSDDSAWLAWPPDPWAAIDDDQG